MGTKEKKEVVRQAFNLLNQHKADECFEYFALDYLERYTDSDMSWETWKQAATEFLAAFSDGNTTVDILVW